MFCSTKSKDHDYAYSAPFNNLKAQLEGVSKQRGTASHQVRWSLFAFLGLARVLIGRLTSQPTFNPVAFPKLLFSFLLSTFGQSFVHPR